MTKAAAVVVAVAVAAAVAAVAVARRIHGQLVRASEMKVECLHQEIAALQEHVKMLEALLQRQSSDQSAVSERLSVAVATVARMEEELRAGEMKVESLQADNVALQEHAKFLEALQQRSDQVLDLDDRC